MSSHNFSHSPMHHSMSQQSYIQQPAYAQGGPVQAISHPQYTTMTSVPRNVSARSSSSSWDRDADKLLMEARARDMNWGPIQQAYFPNKSANACRKRHERLMSKRNAAQCSGEREERIAHSYITLRKETWSPIAAQTGEKWHVVEQKILSQGLKNIQLSARAYARRIAARGGGAVRHYEDSGVPSLDDLEAEYEDGSSNHSPASGMGVYSQFPDQTHAAQLSAGLYHTGHARSGMVQSTHGQVNTGRHSSRMSSIDSIINGHDGRQ